MNEIMKIAASKYFRIQRSNSDKMMMEKKRDYSNAYLVAYLGRYLCNAKIDSRDGFELEFSGSSEPEL